VAILLLKFFKFFLLKVTNRCHFIDLQLMHSLTKKGKEQMDKLLSNVPVYAIMYLLDKSGLI